METNITPGLREPATDGLPAVVDKVSEVASHMKDKVTDLGRTAFTKIDGSRDSAAGGLESAASALRGNAEKVTGIAHSTADTLTSTAEYLRGHDVKAMIKDVEQLVRKNPGPSLIAATALGFLMARAFRRND